MKRPFSAAILEALRAPDFELTVEWDLDQLLDFIATWSGAQAYIRERGEHPFQLIAPELAAVWSDPGRRHTLRWPLDVRALRL